MPSLAPHRAFPKKVRYGAKRGVTSAVAFFRLTGRAPVRVALGTRSTVVVMVVIDRATGKRECSNRNGKQSLHGWKCG